MFRNSSSSSVIGWSLVQCLTSHIEETLLRRDDRGIRPALVVHGGCTYYGRIFDPPPSLAIDGLSEENCLVVGAEESVHTVAVACTGSAGRASSLDHSRV